MNNYIKKLERIKESKENGMLQDEYVKEYLCSVVRSKECFTLSPDAEYNVPFIDYIFMKHIGFTVFTSIDNAIDYVKYQHYYSEKETWIDRLKKRIFRNYHKRHKRAECHICEIELSKKGNIKKRNTKGHYIQRVNTSRLFEILEEMKNCGAQKVIFIYPSQYLCLDIDYIISIIKDINDVNIK